MGRTSSEKTEGMTPEKKAGGKTAEKAPEAKEAILSAIARIAPDYQG